MIRKAAWLAALVVGSTALAEEHRVTVDPSRPGCGIQHAIDRMKAGDRLVLPAGTVTLRRSLRPIGGTEIVGSNTVLTVPKKPAVIDVATVPEKGATTIELKNVAAMAIDV